MIQENPQYFRPEKITTTGAWENWEPAIQWMLFLAGVVTLLVLYKLLRKFIWKGKRKGSGVRR